MKTRTLIEPTASVVRIASDQPADDVEATPIRPQLTDADWERFVDDMRAIGVAAVVVRIEADHA